MKARVRLVAGLTLFALLLAGCASTNGGSSSGGDTNPPVTSDTFTVVWKNYDGSVLETDTNVEKGSMPSYDGAIPTRESTQQYSYAFEKWTPSLSVVVSDITYTATYIETLTASKISFDLDGGTTTSSTNPIYVSSIKSEDFFFNVTKANYNFRGWSYNGQKIFDQKGNLLFNPTMVENMTFKAIFAQDAYLTIISNLNGAATISGEGAYAYNSYVDVNVNVSRGYIFIGWYDYSSGALLSNQETYKYMMWSEDVTLEARFKYANYIMSVKSAHPLLGSVMIKGDYNYLEESTKTFDYLSGVTISAYTKTDEYRFLGWFNESGNLVETNAVYTFAMPYNDYNLYARWDAPSFNVNVSKNHENAGTVTGSGPYEYNSSVTVSAITNKGYTFDGIYKNDSKITSGNSYTFNMPFEGVDLLIKWNLITYTITYNLNGGANSSSNPSSYNVESPTINLANPTKTGYTFTGWTSDGSSITSIPTGSTGNLTLTANWSVNSYQVSVVINNESLGSVSGSGSYNFGSSVTLTASPISDNVFKGWYSDSGLTTLLSASNPYTFNLESEGVTVYAKFFTKAEDEEEARAIKYAARPILSSDGKTITYGLYPQKNVNDSTLVSALNTLTTPESNGWYLYNNDYYAKVSAMPYKSSYGFDNGATIVSGTTYWFKCEPITWNVLSNNDGEYYVLSSVLLDAHIYNEFYGGTKDGHYCNNYEYSEIRAWLNNDFYNSAFALGNSHIQTTTVDNSASTTDSSTNSFACNNTQDKVFLPSYKDYINSSYGFSTSTGEETKTRYCKTTDWAKARGAYYSTSSSYLYNGFYWTRSPDSGNSYSAWYVYGIGSLNGYSNVDDTYYSVRPALTIKIA